MGFPYVRRRDLEALLLRIDDRFARPGSVALVGETTQLFEGWREWVGQIVLTAEVAPADRADFDRSVQEATTEMGLEVHQESPAELIPLPGGVEQRARSIGPVHGLGGRGPSAGGPRLTLSHFDPYSVALLCIARGDESDYDAVILFLEHGWVEIDRLDALLGEVLPQFSFETIQQDPAEFRRRYRGLQQMWTARRTTSA